MGLCVIWRSLWGRLENVIKVFILRGDDKYLFFRFVKRLFKIVVLNFSSFFLSLYISLHAHGKNALKPAEKMKSISPKNYVMSKIYSFNWGLYRLYWKDGTHQNSQQLMQTLSHISLTVTELLANKEDKIIQNRKSMGRNLEKLRLCMKEWYFTRRVSSWIT